MRTYRWDRDEAWPAGGWYVCLRDEADVDEPCLILHHGGGRVGDVLGYTRERFPGLRRQWDIDCWHWADMEQRYADLVRTFWQSRSAEFTMP